MLDAEFTWRTTRCIETPSVQTILDACQQTWCRAPGPSYRPSIRNRLCAMLSWILNIIIVEVDTMYSFNHRFWMNGANYLFLILLIIMSTCEHLIILLSETLQSHRVAHHCRQIISRWVSENNLSCSEQSLLIPWPKWQIEHCNCW